MLTPRVEVRAGDFLDGEARERVRQRLQLFVKGEIERRLAPLFAAAGAAARRRRRAASSSSCRLRSALSRPRTSRRRSSRSIAPARRALARLGVRFGTETRLCRAAARPRGGALPRAAVGGAARPPGAAAARRAQPRQGDRGRSRLPPSFYAAIGRRVLAGWRCGRTGSSGWRRRRAAAPGSAGLPPMPNWRRSAASLPASCAACCWRSAIARSSKAATEFFVGQPRRRAPQTAAADAPPAAARRPSVRQTEGAAIRLNRSHVDRRREPAPERAKARLDQWLWFARFVKSRSLGGAAMRRRRRRDQWQPGQRSRTRPCGSAISWYCRKAAGS